MGHMKKRRQGIQSTRNEIKTPYPVTDIDKGSDKGQRTNLVFVKKIIVNEATGVLYANFPGPFSVLSGQGNGYIWIFYAYDCNAVMTIPMNTRHDSEIHKAFQTAMEGLTVARLKPTFIFLDNEISNEMKRTIRS